MMSNHDFTIFTQLSKVPGISDEYEC